MTRSLLSLCILSICALGAATASSTDIQTLYNDLNRPEDTDRAAKLILQAASRDPDSRKFIESKLPQMIARQNINRVWINAVWLAGNLRMASTIPELVAALSRGVHPVSGPKQSSFSAEWRLEDDPLARALANIGDLSVPPVVNLLGHTSDWRTKRRCILILANVNTDVARNALRERLVEEHDPRWRKLIEDSLRQ